MLITLGFTLLGVFVGFLGNYYLLTRERKRKLGHFKKLDRLEQNFEQVEKAKNEPQKYIANILGRFFTLMLWCFLLGVIITLYILMSVRHGWQLDDITLLGSFLLGIVLSPFAAFPSVLWILIQECAWLIEPGKRKEKLEQKEKKLEREASVDGIKLRQSQDDK